MIMQASCTSINRSRPVAAIIVAMVCVLTLLSACSSAPTVPAGATAARAKLTQLRTNRQLAAYVPVEIKAAEEAVRAAERPQQDSELAEHLVFMADHKIEIAYAWAERRHYDSLRKTLRAQEEMARLDFLSREADRAMEAARTVRTDADTARADTERFNQ